MKYMIVVDYQNDFVTGALRNEEAIAIKENLMKAIKEYDEKGYQIIFTRDTHSENYLNTLEGKHLPIPHCVKGTWGWQIEDDIRKAYFYNGILNFRCIDKPTFGFVDWKDFLANEEDIEDIVICGVCTDICVVSNTLILKAMFPTVDVTVLKNCCAGLTPEKHAHAIDTMASCQCIIKEV